MDEDPIIVELKTRVLSHNLCGHGNEGKGHMQTNCLGMDMDGLLASKLGSRK